MPITYKISVTKALKEKGYNTTRIRREKIFPENVMQAFRDNHSITFNRLSQICEMLDCQPGDILEYVPDPPSSETETG